MSTDFVIFCVKRNVYIFYLELLKHMANIRGIVYFPLGNVTVELGILEQFGHIPHIGNINEMFKMLSASCFDFLKFLYIFLC